MGWFLGEQVDELMDGLAGKRVGRSIGVEFNSKDVGLFVSILILLAVDFID